MAPAAAPHDHKHRIHCFTCLNSGCHTHVTRTVSHYTLQRTHKHTLCPSPSEARFRQGKPGTPGEPLAPPHLNHDIVIVNVGTAGTLGAGGTGFPCRRLPHPHSGAGRARHSRNELDLAGRGISPPQSSGALGPFAEGASLRRYLRPSSDHLAAFSEPPGSPAHLCPSHTWASPPPGPGCRPEF